MKRTNLTICLFFTVIPLMFLAAPNRSEAATLFSENFSTGIFNPVDWSVSDPGNGQAVVADSGGGDFAAYTVGPSPYDFTDWQYNFHSLASYPRGTDLRCTFKSWKDPTKPTWAGAVNFGIMGPFHLTGFNPLAVYGNMAVTVEGGAVPMQFNSKGPFNQGTAVTVPLSTAFNASTTKATGVWIRVTLGNTSGGLLEWSTNGVNYTVDTDNRDLVGHNTAANVVLGFGTHAGAVWIDDIVVENSVAPPAPNLNVDPLAGLDFGFEREAGAASAVQSVTLENTGVLPLTFSSISITGAAAAQFAFSPAPSLASLAPGATKEVDVVYAPLLGTGGALPHTANITVNSNDPDTPTSNTALRGISEVLNPLYQEILFYEDWSSCAFSANWTLFDAMGNGDVAVQNSGGDCAAFTVGPNPYDFTDWAYYYYSTNTFPRGSSLRCTFLVWKDPTKPTWAGPVNFGVMGPFHNAQNPAAIYGNLEAGLEGGSLPLNFDATGMFNSGTPTSGAFQTAFSSSTSRTNGVWVRVTLGDTMGARFEWSTDGVHFIPEIDTREISGASAANVYLGFGTHAGAVFIDTITVERISANQPPPPSGVNDWNLYE
jgi:hypothetical protein